MKKENAQQGAQSISVSENEYSTTSTMQVFNNTQFDDLTMSSREIADLTEKRHSDVMRDTRNMLDGLEIEQNALLRFDNSGANGRTVEYFCLPKDLSLTLVSGYSVKMRYAITKRWLELEAARAPQAPGTMIEALELALAKCKQSEEQQLYIEQTKGDVEFAQAVSSSKSGVNLEVFGKTVGIGRNKLFAWLRKERILMSDPIPKYSKSHNMPYQHYIDAEYFTIKRNIFNTTHGRERGFTPLITGKGEVWLTKKLRKAGLLDDIPGDLPALTHQ